MVMEVVVGMEAESNTPLFEKDVRFDSCRRVQILIWWFLV